VKYPLDFRQQVVEMAKKESIRRTADFYKIPVQTVIRWKKSAEDIELPPTEEMSEMYENCNELPVEDASTTEQVDCQVPVIEDEELSELQEEVEDQEQQQEMAETDTQNENRSPINTDGQAQRCAEIREQISLGIKDSYDIKDILMLENEKLRNENRRLKLALLALVQDPAIQP